MTSQEKVFFKVNAKKRKNTTYIQLFDAVDMMNEYNEIALKKNLNLFNVNNFKVLKSYTIEAVLDSLQKYYANDSPFACLTNYIQQIEVLIQKQLYDLAFKLLKKARKLAETNYLFEELNSLLLLETTLAIRSGNIKNINRLLTLYPKINENDKILQNFHEYNFIRLQISSTSYLESWEDKKIRNELNLLLKNPLMSSEKEALSVPAKLIYYFNKGNIYFRLNESEKSLDMHLCADKLFEINPMLEVNNRLMYVTNLSNICGALVNLKEYNVLESYFTRINQYKKSIPSKLFYRQIASKFDIIFIMELIYLIKTFKLDEALNRINVHKFNEKYAPPISYITYHANIFLVYFYLENYKKALYHVNKILNLRIENSRNDIINQFKIINMVIHYELGNEFMLQSLCQANYRYFADKKEVSDTLKLILDFYRKLPDTDDKEEAFIQLRTQLQLVTYKGDVDSFDMISYLTAKIENRSFIEVLKEKG